MNPFKPLTTPEYFFRPRQILVRLKRSIIKPRAEVEPVILPWGATLKVRPHEVIGSNIWYYGIFDLEVAEAVVRLLDTGETALDIGANIGQMTSLMRHRTGPNGRVLAFEPHPELFGELAENAPVQENGHTANVVLHNIGLSDSETDAFLEVSASIWNENRGTARVAGAAPCGVGMKRIHIHLKTLDSILGSPAEVGLCKIDVEGHELAVFKGATKSLEHRVIRDIIFEDTVGYQSDLQLLLRHYGYSIFSLHTRMWRPLLKPVLGKTSFIPIREGCNFLATLNPERAIARFMKRGWQALTGW